MTSYRRMAWLLIIDFPSGTYFCHQRQKYAKTPLNTYGFKHSLSALRTMVLHFTPPHARGNCRANLSHIEQLSTPTIAAAPVLVISAAGILVDQNERGSATRTAIHSNYGIRCRRRNTRAVILRNRQRCETRRGSFETRGFKWHSLVTFFC